MYHILKAMAGNTEFSEYLGKARTALSGGDIATARLNMSLAATVLAEMPNASSDGTSVTYANALAAMEKAIEMASESQNGGIVRQNIEFYR